MTSPAYINPNDAITSYPFADRKVRHTQMMATTSAFRDRSPFGQRMHRARVRSGLTQTRVCELIGCSQSGLAQFERTLASSSHVVQFARLYGVDPEWLAAGDGAEPDWSLEIGRHLSDPWVQGQAIARSFAALPASERIRAHKILQALLSDRPAGEAEAELAEPARLPTASPVRRP